MAFLIDTHCHLDQYQNGYNVLNKTVDNGVFTVAVTNRPYDYQRVKNATISHKRLRVAVGSHPLFAQLIKPVEFQLFTGLLEDTNYVGEVGLDFSKKGLKYKAAQIRTFENVLESVGAQRKLLTIHSRRAEADTLSMLQLFGIRMAIFHWYSGPIQIIEKIINTGFYLSVNPAMTRSKKGQKVIASIPKERLLTETDGPYIKVNGREALPEDVSVVVKYLTKNWKLDFSEVVLQIHTNLITLVT